MRHSQCRDDASFLSRRLHALVTHIKSLQPRLEMEIVMTAKWRRRAVWLVLIMLLLWPTAAR